MNFMQCLKVQRAIEDQVRGTFLFHFNVLSSNMKDHSISMSMIRNLELGDKIYSQIKSLPRICQKYISKFFILKSTLAKPTQKEIEDVLSVSQKLSVDQSANNDEYYTNSDLKHKEFLLKNYEELKQFELKVPIDKTINSPVYKFELETRNPSGWLESLSGMNTWTNREINWLQSNPTFVFAVTSKLEVNKWICIINYIAHHLE